MYSYSRDSSPVIILSPHQHQFDPITRAAHSLHRPLVKPVMDKRPYDRSLSDKGASKRSRDDLNVPELNNAPSSDIREDESNDVNDVGYSAAKRTHQMDDEIIQGLRHTGHSVDQSNGATTKAFEHDSSMRIDINTHLMRSCQVPCEIPDQSLKRHERQACEPAMASQIQTPKPEAEGIDLYKRLLGAGWSTCGQSEEAAAGMRGFARFIENNYSLTDVTILAGNQSADMLLIHAYQGYFVFSEDLRSGQCLAKEQDRAIQNFHTRQFEGVVMRYVEKQPALLSQKACEPILSTTGSHVGAMELD